MHDEHPLVQYASPITNRPDDVYLSPAPLYHTAPVVFSSMAHRVGGTVVVLERWDPDRVPRGHRALPRHHRAVRADDVRATAQAAAEVRERDDVSSLRLVSHAAAPCPVEVKRQIIEWLGPIVWEYYAGSENVGSTMVGPEEWLAHPGTVGQPRMTTVHICDDDHNELPVGEVGNIWFDTPGASFEYHGDPEKTARAGAPRAGSTSATSATSTRRATSTSPTARASRSSAAA